MNPPDDRTHSFWGEAFALRGSVTLRVLPSALVFGWIAALVYVLQQVTKTDLSVEVGPYEAAGIVLGLLLVLRTNSGYDRWWEARKLWGGIVNQSRNLVLTALAQGPDDPAWRERLVRWAAAFPHAARARLRGQRSVAQWAELLGEAEAAKLAAADNPALLAAERLEGLLQEARGLGMDGYAFLAAENQRAALVDHLGGCERILRTPLAAVYSITIRRFLFLFLVTLPFGLLHKMKSDWLIPAVEALVAYMILGMDQIGIELQQPFSPHNLSHLPLDQICGNIQRDLLTLLAEMPGGHPLAATPRRMENAPGA
jgi:putative membrane protein